MTRSSESMISMAYCKDFTNCIVFLVLYLKVYMYNTEISREKVGYWKVRVIKKREFMLYKNVFIDTNFFFKEEEIQSLYENKLKKF